MAPDEHNPPPALPAARRPRGALEAEVLGVLRQAAPQPLTSTQMLERLGGTLADSTVVTTLTRLYDKRLVTRARRGRGFVYAPATDSGRPTTRPGHHRNDPVTDERPGHPKNAREAVFSRFAGILSGSDEHLLRRLLSIEPVIGSENGAQA